MFCANYQILASKMFSMDNDISNLRKQLSCIKDEFTKVLSNDIGDQVNDYNLIIIVLWKLNFLFNKASELLDTFFQSGLQNHDKSFLE
jgi:hypothetical protein